RTTDHSAANDQNIGWVHDRQGYNVCAVLRLLLFVADLIEERLAGNQLRLRAIVHGKLCHLRLLVAIFPQRGAAVLAVLIQSVEVTGGTWRASVCRYVSCAPRAPWLPGRPRLASPRAASAQQWCARRKS